MRAESLARITIVRTYRGRTKITTRLHDRPWPQVQVRSCSTRRMGIDVNRVIAQLADAGLDLVHAFDAHAIGELARAEAALLTPRPLARWARLATGPRLGLLVGNSRAVWPCFVRARASLPEANPFDTYVVRAIEAAFDREHVALTSDAHAPAGGEPLLAHVFYSHRTYDGAFLPFQPLAVAVGLAASTDAGLVVHPIYGPWFALRAVIVLDGDPPSAPAPIAKPCACTGACERALETALADSGNWRAWLAVRDACSLRAWRYSDEQIRFHYASAWPSAGQTKTE